MTEPAEEARTRQGLYRFASAAIRPPASETFESLGPAADFLSSRDLTVHAFSLQWFDLARSLDDLDDFFDLEPEYVRLFGVGPASTPAPPFESFFRVPKAAAGSGGFVSKLEAEYRKMGVPRSGRPEPPDHISSELEAMSFLCRLEAEAWESMTPGDVSNALELQRAFLNRHLAIWVPRFAERVRAARPLAFYESLAKFIHAFVIHERNLAAMRVAAVGTA